MLFEQVNGTKGTDFSELRAYMIANLMWNPDQDVDKLIKHFLAGYYGMAGKYLYDYLRIMQGGLLASGIPLWIYDSPISHKSGMLNKNLLKTYNEIFDKAEQVVAEDKPRLDRVRVRSEEHTSELQSCQYLVCRLLLEKKKIKKNTITYLV